MESVEHEHEHQIEKETAQLVQLQHNREVILDHMGHKDHHENEDHWNHQDPKDHQHSHLSEEQVKLQQIFANDQELNHSFLLPFLTLKLIVNGFKRTFE